MEALDPEDIDTKSLIEYNTVLKNDRRIETIMLPVRDGLSICRKK